MGNTDVLTDEHPDASGDNDNVPVTNLSPRSTNLSKKQELQFQENLLKKDGQLTEMDRVVKSLEDEMKRLRLEVEARKESEEQMKQVLKEYEKTKSVVEGFKQNEDTLKSCLDECTIKLQRQDDRYDRLKSHAEDTLEKANKEIDDLSRSQDNEIARLTAMLKKTEMT